MSKKPLASSGLKTPTTSKLSKPSEITKSNQSLASSVKGSFKQFISKIKIKNINFQKRCNKIF